MDTERARVADAFAATPRARFLPPGVRDRASVDAPLPIGHGATNSQPWTVRFMLERLRVPSGGQVLDVGGGGTCRSGDPPEGAGLAGLGGPGE